MVRRLVARGRALRMMSKRFGRIRDRDAAGLQNLEQVLPLSRLSIQTTFSPRTNRLANGRATLFGHHYLFALLSISNRQTPPKSTQQTIYSFQLPPAFAFSYFYYFSASTTFTLGWLPAARLPFGFDRHSGYLGNWSRFEAPSGFSRIRLPPAPLIVQFCFRS